MLTCLCTSARTVHNCNVAAVLDLVTQLGVSSAFHSGYHSPPLIIYIPASAISLPCLTGCLLHRASPSVDPAALAGPKGPILQATAVLAGASAEFG